MKKIRVAINGFGRIGRHAAKIILQQNKGMQLVAINDLTDNKTLAHLFSHDTAYPEYPDEVGYDEAHLIIGKKKIKAYAERDPSVLPWKKLKIDVVLECTGVFRDREGASQHLDAGAQKVVISAPAKGDGVNCYVRGVNCKKYRKDDIVDNASCTTNCVAPIVQILEKSFGIEKALMTTVHSYTADQRLQDAPHKDLRRARAAAQNIIPTSTGAAIATTKAIPSMEGNFDGLAIRVPTVTVSLTDFSLVLAKEVTVEQVNKAFIKASQTSFKGILAVTEKPLVSSDFIGDPHSATVDLSLTNVVGGNLVKVIAWYDNEWGYANRLVEMAMIVGK